MDEPVYCWGQPAWPDSGLDGLWQHGPVRVLTWNLWWRHGPWQQRREAIAATLAELAPDVCGLPEIWGDRTENLAAELADEVRLLGGHLTEPVVPGQVLVDAWRYADRDQPDQPGATWDHRNPYLADNPEPDVRIDYVLVGPPRAGRGRVRSARLAGAAPVAGVWPSDHFAVVAELDDGA